MLLLLEEAVPEEGMREGGKEGGREGGRWGGSESFHIFFTLNTSLTLTFFI